MACFAIVRGRACQDLCVSVVVAAAYLAGGSHAYGAGAVGIVVGSTGNPSESSSHDSSGTSWHEKTSVAVEPSAENWIGFEGYRRVAALYTGITWAPFTNLRQDGLRLRAIVGQSLYAYSGLQFDAAAQGPVYDNHIGTGRFIDLLAGWQFSRGGTTVKAFGGYGEIANGIAPFDTEAKIQGTARGAKGAIEIWHNWTPSAWTSLDLAGARANGTYSALLRTGWRLDPEASDSWAIGPELAQIGNSGTMIRRLGLFVRWESLENEFTVSGGVSKVRDEAPMAYMSGQYLVRF